jgi:hypothetical protein
MASSEGILGMTVNPLRFHLLVHYFLCVMQTLWRYSPRIFCFQNSSVKNPCREVSDFCLLVTYSFYVLQKCILLFYEFNVKISLKYSIINIFSFSVKYCIHYLNILCYKPILKFFSFFLSFFLSFLIWLLLPIHCRCRVLLLHPVHTHTHTHTVGFLWTRDRPLVNTLNFFCIRLSQLLV